MKQKPTIPSAETEADRLRLKCKDLKQRIGQLEGTSELASLAVGRLRYLVRRSRFEYTLLLHMLNEADFSSNSDSRATLLQSYFQDVDLSKVLVNKGTSKSPQHLPVLSTKKAKRPPKKPRDPDLPKRPTNAYLIFCDLEKDKIRKSLQHDRDVAQPGEGVHKGNIDLSRGLSDAWKLLDEESRKPYYALYEEDRRRYQRELKEYQRKKVEEESPTKKQKVERLPLPLSMELDSNAVDVDVDNEVGVSIDAEADAETDVYVDADIDHNIDSVLDPSDKNYMLLGTKPTDAPADNFQEDIKKATTYPHIVDASVHDWSPSVTASSSTDQTVGSSRVVKGDESLRDVSKKDTTEFRDNESSFS
ncbi:hypothetical protein LJB42_000013 [Komagataella kurtzmanii]|nr:hypothetical protein LJB42_000013 [Komagataella kurtzmanii]